MALRPCETTRIDETRILYLMNSVFGEWKKSESVLCSHLTNLIHSLNSSSFWSVNESGIKVLRKYFLPQTIV